MALTFRKPYQGLFYRFLAGKKVFNTSRMLYKVLSETRQNFGGIELNLVHSSQERESEDDAFFYLCGEQYILPSVVRIVKSSICGGT